MGSIARVVGGLATTGLPARRFDGTTGVFEQFDCRKSHCRPEQIDQTRDKQRYSHSAWTALISPSQGTRIRLYPVVQSIHLLRPTWRQATPYGARQQQIIS